MPTRIEVNNGHGWLDLDEVSPGKFVLVGENVTANSNWGSELGFRNWPAHFTDRETNGDIEYLGVSRHLTCEGVVLRTGECEAPSLELLQRALSQVTLVGFDSQDI